MIDPTLRGRMLYLVGGAGNAERVDVSDLFAKRLAGYGLKVDYVIFNRDPAACWRQIQWRGAGGAQLSRIHIGMPPMPAAGSDAG